MPLMKLDWYQHCKDGPRTLEEVEDASVVDVAVRLNMMEEKISVLYAEAEELEEKLAKMDEIVSTQIDHLDPDNP